MAGCFISYSSTDRIMIEGLADSLRQHHFDVWIDFESIAGGTQWEAEIKKALAQADICLVALTPDSVKSDWVKREIELAREASKTIVPLIMREVPLPKSMKTLDIDDLQYINFARYGLKVGLEQLLQALPKQTSDIETETETRRALIVEDVRAQQLAVRQVLASCGLETRTAHDFETAMELIRSEKFKLVTLDMQLDEMDTGGQHGMLLLDELHTYQKNVPIIIISALDWSGREVRDFLREHKAFDFLPKPFKPAELRSVVEEALKSERVERNNDE